MPSRKIILDGWYVAGLKNLQALGVEHLGQSGDLTDLHRVYRIDEDAILDAVAAACLARLGA